MTSYCKEFHHLSSRVVGRVPLHHAARATVSGIPIKAKLFWEHTCREGIELKPQVKIFYISDGSTNASAVFCLEKSQYM